MLNQNHIYNTRAATYHVLDMPQVKTSHFRQYSVNMLQASETWNKLQRTQNIDLLTSALSGFKKALFQAYLAKYSNNTQSNLLFIIYCNFLFYYFFFFVSLMSSLLVTHILDYQYDNYFVKYIDYCYCYYFYCYFDHYSCCKCYYYYYYYYYYYFQCY